MRAPIILTLLFFAFLLPPLAAAATLSPNLPHEALQSSSEPTLGVQGASAAKPLHMHTHMLVLKCPSKEGYSRVSRVSVLDLRGESGAGPDMDIALVSGHGLIGPDGGLSEGCFVQDFAGGSAAVSALRIAPDYRAGTAADWGLIAFPRMKTRGLIRYPLRAADISELEAGAGEGAFSRFASARGRPENGQNCKILPRRFAGLKGQGYDGVLAHNCRAIAGQSGAPFSTAQNELLGIHLGTVWTVYSPFTGRPARYGYLRRLDADMIKAIRGATADMSKSKK